MPNRARAATESDSRANVEVDWRLVDRIERAILNEAPTWTEEFQAGAGVVVGVRDAAVVAARVMAREA